MSGQKVHTIVILNPLVFTRTLFCILKYKTETEITKKSLNKPKTVNPWFMY